MGKDKRPSRLKAFLARLTGKKIERWPRVQIENQPEPVFFFLLVNPFGGSTALAKLLDTSPKSMTLHHSGEGQWLIPGLYELGQWHHDMEVDWESVRTNWLKVYQQRKKEDPELSVVIEKSPPNVMRAEQLQETFANTRFLGFTRNPYATCSSVHSRFWVPTYLVPSYRAKRFRKYANAWVYQASWIKYFVEKYNIEYFSYEQLCADMSTYVEKIKKACPELGDINTQADLKVKNNKAQKFSNRNQPRIDQLSSADVKAINQVLSGRPDVLEFFGYELMRPEDAKG